MNYKTVCNGITNYLEATDLESAMAEADAAASYCQEDITLIESDENGSETEYVRKWWDVKYNEKEDDSKNPIEFGDFGYYSDWEQVG